MPQVEFPHEGRTIEVSYGANLRQAALDNNIDIYGFPFNISNCRGHGLCGTCKVRVEPETNLSDRTNTEVRKLKASPLRLACQATVEGDIACYTQVPLVTTRAVEQEACYIIISRERLEMVQLVDEQTGGQQNVFLSLAEVQEIAREVGDAYPNGNWEIRAFDDPLTTQEFSFSYNSLRVSRTRLAQLAEAHAQPVGA